jgi:hypothetical protein
VGKYSYHTRNLAGADQSLFQHIRIYTTINTVPSHCFWTGKLTHVDFPCTRNIDSTTRAIPNQLPFPALLFSNSSSIFLSSLSKLGSKMFSLSLFTKRWYKPLPPVEFESEELLDEKEMHLNHLPLIKLRTWCYLFAFVTVIATVAGSVGFKLGRNVDYYPHTNLIGR